MLTVKGRMYKDIKDFCSRNKLDICYDTVIRKTKGKSIPEKEKILESLLEGNIILLGIKFKSMNEACRFFGVSLNTSQIRRKRGWSVRDSILGKEPVTELSRKCVERLVSQRVEEGYAYDECLQFSDEDHPIQKLDKDAERFVDFFFNLCEIGQTPRVACDMAKSV